MMVVSLELLVFAGGQDAARLPAFGLADYALFLQQVHQAGGPRVADVQPPLEKGRRDTAVLPGQLTRLLHQGVFFCLFDRALRLLEEVVGHLRP